MKCNILRNILIFIIFVLVFPLTLICYHDTVTPVSPFIILFGGFISSFFLDAPRDVCFVLC